MSRYRILESVGSRVEGVHDYDDLEIHHPSKRGREPGRVYATIDGDREEVLKTRTRGGEHMVSKDFILQDARGSARVPVPSPVDGYVGRVDRANGVMAIYDRKDGELLVQVRHMDLRSSALAVGDTVRYGEALGIQSGFGKGNPRKYGVHVHMDFNEAHLDRFDGYLRDMDRGRLTPDGLANRTSASEQVRVPASRADNVVPILEDGSRGADVERLQLTLTRMGYRDASGRDLAADGDFGERTREALKAFQRDRGLEVDGRAGRDTRAELAKGSSQLVTDVDNPGHGLYRQSMHAVSHMERAQGLPSGAHSERIAGALCARAARDGLERIDRVEINADRSLMRAVEVSSLRDEPGLNRSTQPVSTLTAATATLAASSDLVRDHAAAQTRDDDAVQVRRSSALTV